LRRVGHAKARENIVSFWREVKAVLNLDRQFTLFVSTETSYLVWHVRSPLKAPMTPAMHGW